MTIKELLLHEIETLPEILVEEMLDYVQKIKKNNGSVLPEGKPANYLLQFEGRISKEDLKIMANEIEKECEKIAIKEKTDD